MRKSVTVFVSAMLSVFATCNINATEVLILSGSSADVEQFTNNQGRYLSIETNRIIFEDIKGDFTLTHEYIPRARQFLKMGLRHPTCAINHIKTPKRSENYFFSLPVNLFSTLRLYQKGSDGEIPSNLLDEDGNVTSLVELLNTQSNKNILLVKDIEYPTVLQKQIDMLTSEQVLFLNSSDLQGANVHLIERDRANFIVDYPQVVNDWYAKAGSENTLKSYAIAGMKPLVAGHLMCNQSALDSGVLSAVNESILKLYQNGSFDTVYANYLNEKEADRINRYLATLLNISAQTAGSS